MLETRLIFVLGYQGALSDWCVRIALDALQLGHSCNVVRVEGPDELAGELIGTRCEITIIVSANPGLRMIDALQHSRHDVIVLQDDPRHALMSLHRHSDLAFTQAVRTIANAAASIQEIETKGMPKALILQPSMDPNHMASAIWRHLRADGLVQPPIPAISYEPWEQWWSQLESTERQLAEGALGYYWGAGRELIWLSTLFNKKEGGALNDAPIDITGVARPLISGPGIRLFSGKWRITFSLLFDDSAIEYSYSLFSEKILLIKNFQPKKLSESFLFDVPVDTSRDELTMFTLHSDKAAFDGHFKLVKCAARLL